jgi:hypothetical protein
VAELSFPTTGGGSVVDANYEALIGTSVPSGLIGNSGLTDLVYGDSSGRQVKVRPNRSAIVRGYRWQTDGAGITRSITANTSGQPRIDLAVLRLNRADWTVTFQVIAGTPAASPVAPSPTQSEGPSGVWELPLAYVAVANQAATILAANVTSRAPYQNSFQYEGAALPPSTMNPRTFYDESKARMFDKIGADWRITGEFTDPLTAAASSGWTAQTIRLQRVNGFVWFYLQVARAGGNIGPETQSVIYNLPAAYRPAMTADFGLVAYYGGTGSVMRCYVDVSTGTVYLQDYKVQVTTGNVLTVHPTCWPALNT